MFRFCTSTFFKIPCMNVCPMYVFIVWIISVIFVIQVTYSFNTIYDGIIEITIDPWLSQNIASLLHFIFLTLLYVYKIISANNSGFNPISFLKEKSTSFSILTKSLSSSFNRLLASAELSPLCLNLFQIVSSPDVR